MMRLETQASRELFSSMNDLFQSWLAQEDRHLLEQKNSLITEIC